MKRIPTPDPPKWTVYFKANQADALTAAFKEYTRKDLARSTRPSLLSQLAKFKELAQTLGRDKVKNKEHGEAGALKIDTDTLKKQVILHLPYLLFLFVFAKPGPGGAAGSRSGCFAKTAGAK